MGQSEYNLREMIKIFFFVYLNKAKANGHPGTLDKKYIVLFNYSYLYKII